MVRIRERALLLSNLQFWNSPSSVVPFAHPSSRLHRLHISIRRESIRAARMSDYTLFFTGSQIRHIIFDVHNKVGMRRTQVNH